MRYFILRVLALSIIILSPGDLLAQETIGETDIEPYTLSGSMGFQTHAYTTSRAIGRKQPLGGLFTANADFSVLGFQSGADIRYSTDDNRLRQSLNKFGFYGSWRWIRLSAGDLNPNYATYGLQGSTIRGGELSLSPGNVFIDLAFGRMNRAVYNLDVEDPRRPAFERWMYAFKAGVGQPTQSFFSLSAFYGKDEMDSIPDTVGVNNYRPGLMSPPAENLGVTPAFQISVFEESFKVGAETTVSAYTRNQNSPMLTADEAGVPDFLTNLFTPRNSTRLSYAGIAHTELSFDVFQMRTQYERILPGYESMGLRQLRDDQHTVTVSPSFQFFDQRWSLDGELSLSEDNLLGNRLSTQTRRNINVTSIVQISELVRLGAGYTRFGSASVSTGSAGREQHNQLSQVFRLFPGFTIIDGSTTHNISVSGIYQMMEVEYPVQDGGQMINESTTKTAAASYALAMASGLTVNGSANIVLGDAPENTFTTLGGSAGAGYSLLEQKLNVNLTVNVSHNQFERFFGGQEIVNQTLQVNGNFVATYRLTDSNSLQLNIRSQNNTIMEGDGLGFSEMEARFRFQQRF